MAIYQLLYVSNLAQNTSTQTIHDIVNTAKKFNTENDITGVLLCRGGVFLQMLEGEKAKIETLFQKIEKDPRHSNIVRIFSIQENDRLFPKWAMGFHEVTDLDIKMVNEFLSWNKLIEAAKDLDNNIILHMLGRFERVLLKS